MDYDKVQETCCLLLAGFLSVLLAVISSIIAEKAATAVESSHACLGVGAQENGVLGAI